MSPTTKNLCLQLKAEAKARKITHQMIADKMGVNRSNVTAILSAYRPPTLDTFVRIADAIGVKITLE